MAGLGRRIGAVGLLREAVTHLVRRREPLVDERPQRRLGDPRDSMSARRAQSAASTGPFSATTASTFNSFAARGIGVPSTGRGAKLRSGSCAVWHETVCVTCQRADSPSHSTALDSEVGSASCITPSTSSAMVRPRSSRLPRGFRGPHRSRDPHSCACSTRAASRRDRVGGSRYSGTQVRRPRSPRPRRGP